MIEKIIKLRKPKTSLPVLEPIQNRFSPRVFSKNEISDQEIQIMFEAARLAPSARNHQPWKYYWMRRDCESYKKLESCIPERNFWYKTGSLFIIACYDPTESNDDMNKWCEYDLGASCISLILQAQDLGYYTRQIGSFDENKCKEIFHVLDPYIPLVILVIGKIGEEKDYTNTDSDILEKEMQPWQRKEKIDKELL